MANPLTFPKPPLFSLRTLDSFLSKPALPSSKQRLPALQLANKHVLTATSY